MKLKELPVGAKLRDSKLAGLFLVASLDHPGYPGVVLIADEPVGNICYDAQEPENPLDDRRKNGSNDYALSNVHQWLNADGDNWYHPASPSDRPPEAYIDPMMPPEFRAHIPPCITDKAPGFLTGLSDSLKNALVEVPVSYARAVAEGSYEMGTVMAKAFLPSQTELGLDIDIEYPDGTRFKLMDDPRMKLCRSGYWTRTPGFHDSEDVVLPYHMRVDDTTGIVRVMEGMLYKFYGNKPCCSNQGVRPVLVAEGSLELSGPDEHGVYTIL